MQDKEALIRLHAFPPPPVFHGTEYKPENGMAHASVTKDSVGKAFLCQSIKKAPEPNMHNFWILRVLWDWDPDCMTSIVVQAIRLQYHPQRWKHGKETLLEKPNKRDRTLVKSYRVISLLNCLGKVVEKVVAEQLSYFCEINDKLHEGQMGARKFRSAIDAVDLLIHKVQEVWEGRKIAGALFMDVKGAFDHISRAQLAQKIYDLGIDDDLIGWTQFFLMDRWVELVIDGHTNPKCRVETGIPQGLPASPILFLIYISGVFSEIESRLPEVTCLSFMDDLRFLAAGNSVIEIRKILKKAGKMTLDWGTRNAVT